MQPDAHVNLGSVLSMFLNFYQISGSCSLYFSDKKIYYKTTNMYDIWVKSSPNIFVDV